MRYSFVLPLPDGMQEIGFTSDPVEMLRIFVIARDMKNPLPTVVDADSGRPITEAEIKAAAHWRRS